ncbi:MAG TPA: hypothetical protein ENN80_08325, partial [Candidatus Hydrogenedentes bacterium]|nr:hypothetical protein [Candidatus Hydrogenedentota bacterium]
MNPLFLLVPALLVVAAVAYGVTRALARVWHEHAIKIALLERLETHPDLVPSYQELEKLVERISTTKPPLKQDLTVTGIILT